MDRSRQPTAAESVSSYKGILSAPHDAPFFGCRVSESTTDFRLFSPRSTSVSLALYTVVDADPELIRMEPQGDGCWSVSLKGDRTGCWYTYLVDDRQEFADPFSHHVTVDRSYRQNPRTLIIRHDYTWGDHDWKTPSDPRDLILYECHIKDMSVYSESERSGSYAKFADPRTKGGLTHLKELGVNAVEFLPLAKFASYEPPYQIVTREGFNNVWNKYEFNHWGYMTSFFMAPESYFASDLHHDGGLVGSTDAAVNEFKNVVDVCHQNGIAVLMDVVFNHTSIFDVNILNDYLADTYIRHDTHGRRLNRSGTGNELRTEADAARRLILDALTLWITEYHVDGFRFDLAGLIDRETWDLISTHVRSLNPNCILIAEPWGGDYVPDAFSEHGWASWNDQFRNGVKGIDPKDRHGMAFSTWIPGFNRAILENVLRGTLRKYEGGLYQSSAHSVNYVESHDGYTLSDFIRLTYRPDLRSFFTLTDEQILPLTGQELSTAKLTAFVLLTTPGICMLHQGQEFANSKICRSFEPESDGVAFIDHNSYEKDDPTNWIDLQRIQWNRSLYRYYQALVRIRLNAPALRKPLDEEMCFERHEEPLHLARYVTGTASGDLFDYYVLINAHISRPFRVTLPSGVWEVIVNAEIASESTLEFVTDEIQVPAASGSLLRRRRSTLVESQAANRPPAKGSQSAGLQE